MKTPLSPFMTLLVVYSLIFSAVQLAKYLFERFRSKEKEPLEKEIFRYLRQHRGKPRLENEAILFTWQKYDMWVKRNTKDKHVMLMAAWDAPENANRAHLVESVNSANRTGMYASAFLVANNNIGVSLGSFCNTIEEFDAHFAASCSHIVQTYRQVMDVYTALCESGIEAPKDTMPS